MKGKIHILIVDDEPAIRLFLSEELSQSGYEVTTASSGEQALIKLEEYPIDLVLLDLKMQGMDGLRVMAEIEHHPLPPVIIMLTAHASLDSAIEAMRRGGHDYLLKPCSTEKLLASVEKGLARRKKDLQKQELLHQIELSARRLRVGTSSKTNEPTTEPRFLEVKGLLLDRKKSTVICQGEPVHLTPSEFTLLQCLMERADQIVSWRELMQCLHGTEGNRWETRQALSTHLWNLRAKIDDSPDGESYIVNVYGQGYRLVEK